MSCWIEIINPKRYSFVAHSRVANKAQTISDEPPEPDEDRYEEDWR